MSERLAGIRRSLRLPSFLRRGGGDRRTARLGPRGRKTAARVVFLAPALVLVMFLVVYPVLQTVYLSFVTSQGTPTLGNYQGVLTDPTTVNPTGLPWPPPLGTLIHNALWIAIHLPISLFFGLWLALILRDVKGSSIVKSAIFLGMVTPMIVGGVILRFLFEEGPGVVPAFFETVGVPSLNKSWLVFRETALLGLIFGSVWLWTGFSLIVYSAGLTTIPKDYFEAAKIDGTPPHRMFFRITFPLLRPMTLVIITMTLLWELKIFDIVYSAVGSTGGTRNSADVLSLQMYRYFVAGATNPGYYGLAAVVATLLTLLTLVGTAWLFRKMVKR
ncbi:MAG TPA: sugar ABC transporter permease [Thermoplasmata archaeon]